nr:unnamed protein product [Callosobruchus analis]
MKTEIKALNQKVEALEKANKKKNLVISGIKIDTNDEKTLKGTVENFLLKELQVTVNLKGAQKIGEKMCVIEMESITDKIEILKNKNKLRYLQEKIFIDSDLTKKEQSIQKAIRTAAKDEKGKGNQTKVGYKKMIVNGAYWKWDDELGKLIADSLGANSKNE